MPSRWTLALTAFTLVAPTVVYSEVTMETINDCLNQGLMHVLTATDVANYAVIPSIARSVAGPAWKTLSERDHKRLEQVVLDTMINRLRERGREFAGAVAYAEVTESSLKYPDQYTISGKLNARGTAYWFQTIAYITTKQCKFYTLNIENVFVLSSWLKKQPAVAAQLKVFGVKQ
jgi:hypothetical protein